MEKIMIRSIEDPPNICTRLFDNATFVRIHLMERFSPDFWEVRGLREVDGLSFG